MHLKIKFFALIALVLLSACATTANYQQMVNQWQGKDVQHLVRVWGEPDAMTQAPNKSRVYMYKHQYLQTMPPPPGPTTNFTTVNGTPTYGSGFTGGFAGKTTVLYCRTWFEINPQGIVVGTHFQGNNCISNRIRDYYSP